MRIIFVEDHIVDDEFGIIVSSGRTGTILDVESGKIEIDSIPLSISKDGRFRNDVIYGFIYDVQPSKYIRLRAEG